MTRFTLYVPASLNDGHTVPNRWTVDFERRLAVEFGGFTRIDAIGGWKSPTEEVIREPMRLYVVDISESAAEFAAMRMRQFAELVKHDLEQECVYLTRDTIDVHMI